jgi:hypothetical protein
MEKKEDEGGNKKRVREIQRERESERQRAINKERAT